MMPIINMNLGLCLHVKKISDNKYLPMAKSKGGEKIYIRSFWEHPFFKLFRKHKMNITLSSDNPNIAGIPLKETITILAGLNSNYKYPEKFMSLKAEELAILCINGVQSIFAKEDIKKEYKNLLLNWIKKYHLNEKIIANYYLI